MRKPIVGISLKIYMNKLEETLQYVNRLEELLGSEDEIELFIFPSMGTVREVGERLKDSVISYGSQNIAFESNGALTGEFSVESLVDMGGSYVELGHAERRKYFNESDEMINQKLILAIENQITPVLCIGETKTEKNEVKECLTRQIEGALKKVPKEKMSHLIIAYEPVWAIGQAEAASKEHIHHVHTMIRSILLEKYGQDVAECIRIIYGGSVSADNVAAIAQGQEVDGVFVGRFGHNPVRFNQIVELVKKAKGIKE